MRDSVAQISEPRANTKSLDTVEQIFKRPESVDSFDAVEHRLKANVDALKRQQSQTANELDAMHPAILDRAFKGEL
jgi:hypothetical protein